MALTRKIPTVRELTHSQYKGWACIWCRKTLTDTTGATVVGRAIGWSGAHDLSCDAYACDECVKEATR